MITQGDRLSGSPVLIKSNNEMTSLKRLSFNERSFDEFKLQEIIRLRPEILPVTEIDPIFAPLIPVGREVECESGFIDNLYINPQGYLTIVETKLWRNPEARREVLGQIIDYAKDVSNWSYEYLNEQVSIYNKTYDNSDFGIIDTLHSKAGVDKNLESSLIDMIIRNMKQGKFLLLIVGDGIREGVEGMVEFLSQTPQLLFTLALVELKIYELEENNNRSLIVLPQVITRTKEIVRAVVRVEGKDIASVHVDVDMQIDNTPTRTSGKRKPNLTLDEFLFSLEQSCSLDEVNFARDIIERKVPENGWRVEAKSSAYMIKLPDPKGSKQAITLFGITQNGFIYIGWMCQQLETLGLPVGIACDYAKDSASLFKNCEVMDGYPDNWTKNIKLNEFKEKYDDFMKVLNNTIARIKSGQ